MAERTVFVEGLGWVQGDQAPGPAVDPRVDLTAPTAGRVKLGVDGTQHVSNVKQPDNVKQPSVERL